VRKSFDWVDGERTIHFGPADDAVTHLGGPGFTHNTIMEQEA